MSLTIPVAEIINNSANPLLAIDPSWNRVPLGKVAEILNGYAFKSELFNDTKGTPLIRIRDIGNNKTDCYYDGAFDEAYIINPGDLLIGMDGDFNSSTWRGPKALLNQRVCKIEVNTNLYDKKFLEYVLPGYLKAINENTSSQTVKHLSSRSISEILLPLPPLSEQQRIVARVEALLMHVNAARDRLSRVPLIMKKFRQGVLAAACSGKLTEGWREENPDVEPTNISEFPSRTKKENEKFLEDLQILKELDFPPLPDGWISSNGDTIFRFITSGSRGWAKYYSDNGVSFIRIGNLTRDSILLDLKNLQKVNPPDSAERKRIRVQKNDILISITADIGSIGFVSSDIGEAYVNQHIALCRPVDQVNPEYIALFLQSENGGKKQFLELQRGATKIGLGLDDIRAVYIPLPPLAEQHEIVRRVGLLFERADAFDQDVAAAARRCERLTQAVLGKAFRGELVERENESK